MGLKPHDWSKDTGSTRQEMQKRKGPKPNFLPKILLRTEQELGEGKEILFSVDLDERPYF